MLWLCVMFTLFSLQKPKEKNTTNKASTPWRLWREPVELPSISGSNRTIADKQEHIQRLISPLAVESLVRLTVWACLCVCERKHAEPEGGCEKAADAESTGTSCTNAKQRDVKYKVTLDGWQTDARRLLGTRRSTQGATTWDDDTFLASKCRVRKVCLFGAVTNPTLKTSYSKKIAAVKWSKRKSAAPLQIKRRLDEINSCVTSSF